MEPNTENSPRTPEQNLKTAEVLLGERACLSIDLRTEVLVIKRTTDGEIVFSTIRGEDQQLEGGLEYVTDVVAADGTPSSQSYENWSNGICIQRERGSSSQARIDYLLDQATAPADKS